jgi:hypothetical protein
MRFLGRIHLRFAGSEFFRTSSIKWLGDRLKTSTGMQEIIKISSSSN